MSKYDTLNPMQREAVFHTEGPLLVLAGAGSGKTRVLTHRIAYLIEEKRVAPWNIMAITFTNKAAAEMRERVDKIVGEGAEAIWVSTFHSSCVRILRRFIDRLGYDTNFTIYDGDDQKTLMKQVLKKMQADPKQLKERAVLSRISAAKNDRITADEFEQQAGADFREKKIAQIYREYQKELKKNNALDFDDLLVKTVELFEANADVLEYYQDKFRYIMVDEYQDTNLVQFKLVDLLAKKYRNICVVAVRDTRKALSALSAAFFDHPAEKMKMIGITGTNGKTTTTTLLGESMKAYQDDVFVVGNIGNPYTVAADFMTEHSIAVAEMSSFQLESIVSFRPNVSAILNYTPDHLNRHHTMEAYIAAKENIARNQTEDDYCVLNYEEPVMRKFAETLKCHVLFFSSQHKLEKGIYLDNDKIIYKNPDEVEVCHVDELQILGTHNYENVMAAVCMAAVYGVPMETIRKAILAFKGVAHRIEYVAEKNGVVYYNDSKGTNPDAAIKAIQAMRRPTILLGGGYDKDSEYTEWINSFDGKVKKLILMGATKEKIARDCEKCDFHDYVYVDTFEEAMNLAVEMAEPGDAVLLSPACASWGMFPNYEVRGDKFKEIVKSL